MDKKLYFEPEIEVVMIETGSLMAGSPTGTDEGGSDTPTGPIDEDEAEGF